MSSHLLSHGNVALTQQQQQALRQQQQQQQQQQQYLHRQQPVPQKPPSVNDLQQLAVVYRDFEESVDTMFDKAADMLSEKRPPNDLFHAAQNFDNLHSQLQYVLGSYIIAAENEWVSETRELMKLAAQKYLGNKQLKAGLSQAQGKSPAVKPNPSTSTSTSPTHHARVASLGLTPNLGPNSDGQLVGAYQMLNSQAEQRERAFVSRLRQFNNSFKQPDRAGAAQGQGQGQAGSKAGTPVSASVSHPSQPVPSLPISVPPPLTAPSPSPVSSLSPDRVGAK